MMELKNEDFPALFLAADKSATAAQHRYIRLTLVILTALVTTAVLSSIRPLFPEGAKGTFALITAGIAALSFILTTFRRALKPERRWFVSRAVAEAVKSMTWKFVSGAKP